MASLPSKTTIENDIKKRSRSPSPNPTIEVGEPSNKRSCFYIEDYGDYLCLDDLTDSPSMESLSYELSKMLDEEEKEEEHNSPPKEEKREPRTRAEKCKAEMHLKIFRGMLGDTCASCGYVTRYWFIE